MKANLDLPGMPYPSLSHHYLPSQNLDGEALVPVSSDPEARLQKVRTIGFNQRRDSLSVRNQNRIERQNMFTKAYSPGECRNLQSCVFGEADLARRLKRHQRGAAQSAINGTYFP